MNTPGRAIATPTITTDNGITGRYAKPTSSGLS
jgi:hypothetical protein